MGCGADPSRPILHGRSFTAGPSRHESVMESVLEVARLSSNRYAEVGPQRRRLDGVPTRS